MHNTITSGSRSVRASRRRSTATLGFLTAVALAATGCASPSPGGGGSADGEVSAPLTIVTRNTAVPSAQLVWAAAEGYFEDAGLDLRINVGEKAQTAQFVSGQADLFWGTQGAVLGIANSEKPVHTILGLDNNEAGWVVTSDDSVESIEDCATVTTAIPGTVMYAWTTQLQTVFDLSWEVTQLNDVPSVLANVVAGRTQCATGNISYFQSGIDDGRLRMIFDPTDEASLPSNWPQLGIELIVAGLPETLEERSADVELFLRTYKAALADYLETDPTEIAETLVAFDAAWSAVGSIDVLAQGIADYQGILNPYDGVVSEDTWDKTLTFFGEGGLDFIAADPERFSYENSVDMTYLEAASGQ